MRLVIFGLTASSAWGNGHATLWRSLVRGLADAGHSVVFFEKDQPFYRAHRDCDVIEGATLVIYDQWSSARPFALHQVREADVVIVTSYCPDARVASHLALDAPKAVRVFYDLDTPVTLADLAAGRDVPYLLPEGLGAFDLVLSFTGGEALSLLRSMLGARRVRPLYGSVDPETHRAATPMAPWSGAISYLGTWSADREHKVRELFVEVARSAGDRRFVLGGAQYPDRVDWPANIHHTEHVSPAEHPAFYCSSPLTLNVTRGAMAALGYCPSGRLFEAAACGVPVLSDRWAGLEMFFEPGTEILTAESSGDVLAALSRSPAELARIGRRARDRVMAEHTGGHRAAELVRLIEEVA